MRIRRLFWHKNILNRRHGWYSMTDLCQCLTFCLCWHIIEKNPYSYRSTIIHSQSDELCTSGYFILFTFYWFCYYSCPDFTPFTPPPPSTPLPSDNPLTIVHVHGSHVQVLWLLNSLCCTLHPHGYSVTTYLYVLISSPPHPFPPPPPIWQPSKCSAYLWFCLWSSLLSLFFQIKSFIDMYLLTFYCS